MARAGSVPCDGRRLEPMACYIYLFSFYRVRDEYTYSYTQHSDGRFRALRRSSHTQELYQYLQHRYTQHR